MKQMISIILIIWAAFELIPMIIYAGYISEKDATTIDLSLSENIRTANRPHLFFPRSYNIFITKGAPAMPSLFYKYVVGSPDGTKGGLVWRYGTFHKRIEEHLEYLEDLKQE